MKWMIEGDFTREEVDRIVVLLKSLNANNPQRTILIGVEDLQLTEAEARERLRTWGWAEDVQVVPVTQFRLPRFRVGDTVQIARLLDDFTSKEIIGLTGPVQTAELLANGLYNYYVGGHYMHEEELEPYIQPD